MHVFLRYADKVHVVNADAGVSHRRLPLHGRHVQKKARFGAFGEWEIPLFYASIVEEHHAVRNRAGVFDISHMGEFTVRGPGALAFLQALFPRDLSRMRDGQAFYAPLLNDQGGMVDDVVIYRVRAEEFLLIVNAGNIAKDRDWISARLPAGVLFEDVSEQFGLLAVQGPKSMALTAKAFGTRYAGLSYYTFQPFQSGMIARTGYTGEAGVEIMVRLDDLAPVWDEIFKAGESEGIVPAGFGARDTLRLEAAMPLYGQDISDDTSPFEAGLGWTVDMAKPSFTGRGALASQKETGIAKKLAGFEMTGRGIARHGCEILKGGRAVGKVTSGSFAPTLGRNIGMGYVPASEAVEGNAVDVVIRDVPCPARVVKLPFYKSKK